MFTVQHTIHFISSIFGVFLFAYLCDLFVGCFVGVSFSPERKPTCVLLKCLMLMSETAHEDAKLSRSESFTSPS